MFATVLDRESTWPRSRRAIAFSDTTAASAACPCVHPSNARAALICLPLIILTNVAAVARQRHVKVVFTP